ncbi:MAG: cytochrome c oxidase subunit I [Polyangiaceae bacterium]
MSRAITADGLSVEKGGKNYLNAEKGLLSWLTTVDHKRIGIMYLVSTFTFFVIAGAFAMAVRLELMHPGKDFMDAKQYNQAFTLHGAIMVFLFIIPSIPGALGNFVLPIMIGAKDVAFPKLNLLSLYLYWTGALFTASSLVSTGLDTGWTFYVPYSANVSQSAVIAVTFGAFILGFSSILTGLNFLVTIHKLRAPGVTFYRLPLMLWSIYATSIVQLLATPVLAITLLLLILERAFGIGIFDPKLGGDPILYQHFFWFYSHPAVYIMILPGMGIVSELVAVHSHRRVFGYKAIAFSSVAIALLGFLVWGHHMFTSGQSELASTVFSFITFFIAVPSGVKVFNWTSTMFKGSIAWNTPMFYAMSFLFLFTIGGLTGLPLAMMGIDLHLHDTYYVVAHFHYVMMGGAVIALIGGLHHWWPKMTGRMFNDGVGKLACLIIFVGFNMTFFTQFFLGARGMPRRYYTYLDQFQPLHAFSSIGSFILGFGMLVMLVNLVRSLFSGARAPANPWGGKTLEWQTSSPPPTENFYRTPVVTHGPYDYATTVNR